MALPTAKFPGAIASVADLRQQVDATPSLLQAPPTLAASLNATDTSFSVATGKGSQLASDNFVVTIDDEIIFVGSRSGDTLSSCTRGVDGTTASVHGSGAAVYANVVAAHHNQVASEVVALETFVARVVLDEIVLGAAAASVTFNNIPADYRNLILKIAARSAAAVTDDDICLQFNGDTGANYDRQYFFANGGSTGQGTVAAITSFIIGAAVGANTPANSICVNDIAIADYARTAWHKSGTCTLYKRRDTSSCGLAVLGANWRSTAAITSIVIFLGSGNNFVANSVFTLYAERASSRVPRVLSDSQAANWGDALTKTLA